MDLPFGYCTNVHAGNSISSVLEQIELHATKVRARLVPNGRLPLGLWFSETAAEQILSEDRRDWLSQWLDERGLMAYTLNGFPQGDFHQPIVKHSVYEPTWNCQSRATYTQRLALILERLLPEGGTGSISTLPLGWPHAPWHAENYSLAADYLHAAARYFQRLADQRGCEIVLAIEPEPGCVIETARDLVEFFERYLLCGPDAEVARRHLTVCHDVCHSSVMFEPQQEALERYRAAGIRVGKVQVSSAIHVPWDTVSGQADRHSALREQVATFNEPKYLHQTTRCDQSGKLAGELDDLPKALALWTGDNQTDRPWRIHFHVPIHVRQLGLLATTQPDIAEACKQLEAHRHQQIAGRDWFTGHYEVETYAWSVLPSELAVADLASGIIQELEYFKDILGNPANDFSPLPPGTG